MTDTPGRQNLGRTSWKRFAALALPTMAITGGLLVAMSQGAMASSFQFVSHNKATITASSLDGTGFVQYGWVDQQQGPSNFFPVAVAEMKTATIKNLCQSVVVSIPGLPDISLMITAGGGSKPVTAKNLVIDMDHLEGDATFTNIEIGRDAVTMDKGPTQNPGISGTFGQQADIVHIERLKQGAWATTAGTFVLNGLKMDVNWGNSECQIPSS